MPDKTQQQVLQRASYDGTLPNPSNQYNWPKKAREMRTDPTISLARQIATAPILAAKWAYEAAEDTPDDIKHLVQTVMDRHRTHLLRNVCRGWMDFGWQGFEKVWKVDNDGNAVYSRFKPLLQDLTTIKVLQSGQYNGMAQESDQITLSVEETLLVSHDVEGTNWYGTAIMRAVETAYDDWVDNARCARKYDARVSGAHWVVYYPTSPGETMFRGRLTSNYDVALALLESLEANGRIAVPRVVDEMANALGQGGDNGWKIELMSDSGSGTTSFVERLKYLDTLKVRGFGLPERSVLEGQFGTKAEAAEHGDFAITAMEQRHEEIVHDINRHAVRQLIELNFGTEYREAVWIAPSPIADSQRAFIRSLYDKIIASPLGFDLAASTIDVEAIQDQLGIPFNADDDTNDDDDPEFLIDEPDTDAE